MKESKTRNIQIKIEVFDNTEFELIESAVKQGLDTIGCDCIIYVEEQE